MQIEEKRFINIGTIGHVDHGKTTFTAAITKALHHKFPQLNKIIDFGNIDKAPEERKRGITINATTITYVTDKTTFSHTDCPGHADYVKNMITGAAQLDAVILIVAADGPDVQTKEHILLASRLGIKNFAVFINKIDTMDPSSREELLEMVKEEIQDEMKKNHVDTDKVFFGQGSALNALKGDQGELDNIANFIVDFDNKIPTPKREIDKPFKFSISETFSIKGRGTVVAGVVETGTLNLNDNVEIVRPGKQDKNMTTTVTGIEAFNQSYNTCKSGDNVGLLLRSTAYEDVSRGDLVTAPNTVQKYKSAQMEMYILQKEEGGRHSPFFAGYRPQFFIRTSDYTGSIHNISVNNNQDAEMVTPGDNCSMIVEFEKLVPVENNLQVIIREGGKTIGQGKIVKVLEEKDIEEFKRNKVNKEKS